MEDKLTRLEAEAIENYIENIYSLKVPEPKPPTKRELSFWNIAGIQAVLYTVAGLGITVYSAVRTGGLFYIMEILLLGDYDLPPAMTNGLGLLAMVTSLLAFELFVLAEGFTRGRNNKSLKHSNMGLYSSIIVIVLSGVFTGLSLVPELSETFTIVFNIIIAIVTSVAGGIVALYSGDNIGFTFAKVDKVRSKLKKDHADNYQVWRDKAVRSYRTSNYAVGSKKAESFQKRMREQAEQTQPVVPSSDEDFFVAYSAIADFIKQNGRIPKTQEVYSLGSNNKLMREAYSMYLVANEESLVSRNLISRDGVSKARKYIEELNVGDRLA